MNKSNIIICLVCAGVSLGLLISGCKRGEEPGAEPNSTGAMAKKEIGEAVEATGQYLSEQKEAFMKQAKQGYSSLESNVNKFMTDFQDENSEKWKQTKAQLNEKMMTAKLKLDELGKESGQTWEQTKQAYNTAVKELKDAYEKAKAEFQNQNN